MCVRLRARLGREVTRKSHARDNPAREKSGAHDFGRENHAQVDPGAATREDPVGVTAWAHTKLARDNREREVSGARPR